MLPHIIISIIRELAFLGLGIALVVQAQTWSEQLFTVIDQLDANVTISGQALTVDMLAEMLRRQGISLIIATVIAAYFVLVVIAHYQQVKNGQAEGRVKPSWEGRQDPPPNPVAYPADA
jgi:hypothetical protein